MFAGGIAVVVVVLVAETEPGVRGNAAALTVLLAGALGILWAIRVGWGVALRRARREDATLTVDNPEEEGRGTDREESEAWKRLRRGEIGRAEYERVRARRRFVRGEWSRAQYHEAVREIEEWERTLPPTSR